METESKLISKFYLGFWLLLGSMIILSIIIIITIILKKRIIGNNSTKGRVVFFRFLLIELTFIVFFVVKFIPYAEDFTSVRDKNFETIYGKVVKYGKATAVGDIATEVKYSFPIIEDESGNRMKLDVYGTVLDGTYEFIYLKHTKLGEIVEIK